MRKKTKALLLADPQNQRHVLEGVLWRLNFLFKEACSAPLEWAEREPLFFFKFAPRRTPRGPVPLWNVPGPFFFTEASDHTDGKLPMGLLSGVGRPFGFEASKDDPTSVETTFTSAPRLAAVVGRRHPPRSF